MFQGLFGRPQRLHPRRRFILYFERTRLDMALSPLFSLFVPVVRFQTMLAAGSCLFAAPSTFPGVAAEYMHRARHVKRNAKWPILVLTASVTWS